MGSTENTKLCDFTSHNNNDFICTPIAPPATSAPSYEIKPALLNLVMKDQFSGAITPVERNTTPMNAIQVQINKYIRMLGKLKERWAREK